MASALARTAREIAEREKAPVVPNVRPLSEIAPESVRWLWHHRIPFGKITILEGMPDVGKSHLTIALAALVSTGGRLPDGEHVERGTVLIVTCEDGLADTVRPRLDAAGGDPSRVLVLSGFAVNGEPERLPIIPDDVPAIRRVVEEHGVTLLIIDPLTAYLSGEVNANRDHDVRRSLTPLQRMAEETGCAVVVIRHLRKAPGGDAISAGGGSIGFTGLARCVLLAAKDPDDASRRVLAWTKNNLAPTPQSLAYRLESDGGEWAHVVWDGVSRYDANALLEAGRPDEERGKTEQAVEWLRDYLSEGPVGAAETKRAGRDNGFSERTLERARERLGAIARRSGFGKGSKVEWHLPPSILAIPSTHTPNTRHVGEYGENAPVTHSKHNGLAYSPTLASMDGEYAGRALSPEEIVAGMAREQAERDALRAKEDAAYTPREEAEIVATYERLAGRGGSAPPPPLGVSHQPRRT